VGELVTELADVTESSMAGEEIGIDTREEAESAAEDIICRR
jgi:hypothetical protein